MCACDEGRECARHRAESERHDDEEQREWEMPDPAPLGAYSTGYQGDSEQYQRAVALILMLEERLP